MSIAGKQVSKFGNQVKNNGLLFLQPTVNPQKTLSDLSKKQLKKYDFGEITSSKGKSEYISYVMGQSNIVQVYDTKAAEVH